MNTTYTAKRSQHNEKCFITDRKEKKVPPAQKNEKKKKKQKKNSN